MEKQQPLQKQLQQQNKSDFTNVFKSFSNFGKLFFDIYNMNFGDPTPDAIPESEFSEQFMGINLPEEVGNQFEVPVVFFTGANDWHVPYTLTDEWFKQINAPHKHQVWFEGSSHYPPTEQPGRFLVELVERVLLLQYIQ